MSIAFLQGRVEMEEKKNRFGSTSKRPANILNAVNRSARSRCRCSLSSLGRWWMPVTHHEANPWIRSKWLISTTRIGEQAGIPYSRCGRTKAPYNVFKRSEKERPITRIKFLALYAASVHGAEEENKLSVCTPISHVYVLSLPDTRQATVWEAANYDHKEKSRSMHTLS